MLVSLGAIGFGLVFGWLLGLYDIRPDKLPAAIALLSGASAAGAGVTAWLGGVSATAPFSVAALVALWVHTQWRSELRKRHPKSNNT
jgi:membrane protein implicated in regulation of membrane protease activity